MQPTLALPSKRIEEIPSLLFRETIASGYEHLSNEQKLWRCVLAYIGLDAIEFVHGRSPEAGNTIEVMRDSFNMVLELTLDFATVAEYAGLTAERAREAIMDQILDYPHFATVLEYHEKNIDRRTGEKIPCSYEDQIEIEYNDK